LLIFKSNISRQRLILRISGSYNRT
jgi:hypothetical protein